MHEYLVKWEGFGHENNSWEREKSFDYCRAEIAKYWESVQNTAPSQESDRSL